MTTRTAPQPTPSTPLYPVGDMLADADGYLYRPTGEPVTVNGRHLTNTEIEIESSRLYDDGI